MEHRTPNTEQGKYEVEPESWTCVSGLMCVRASPACNVLQWSRVSRRVT